jgi:hypothetical protein
MYSAMKISRSNPDRQGIGTDEPSPQAPPSLLVNTLNVIRRFPYFPTGA